jgi:hypothetical protein
MAITRRIMYNGNYANFNIDTSKPSRSTTINGEAATVYGDEDLLKIYIDGEPKEDFVANTTPEIPEGLRSQLTKMEQQVDIQQINSTDACSIFGSLGSIVDDASTAVGEVITQTASELANLAEDAYEDITDLCANISSTISESIGQAEQALSDFLSIESEATEARTYYENLGLTDLVQEIDEALGTLQNELNDVFFDMQKLVATIGDDIEAIVDPLATELSGATTTLLGVVNAGMSGDCKGMNNLIKTLPAGATKNIDTTQKGLTTNASKSPPHSRRLTTKGSYVNFNIDKSKPFRDVNLSIKVRNLETNNDDTELVDYNGLVRVYADENLLQSKFGDEGKVATTENTAASEDAAVAGSSALGATPAALPPGLSGFQAAASGFAEQAKTKLTSVSDTIAVSATALQPQFESITGELGERITQIIDRNTTLKELIRKSKTGNKISSDALPAGAISDLGIPADFVGFTKFTGSYNSSTERLVNINGETYVVPLEE